VLQCFSDYTMSSLLWSRKSFSMAASLVTEIRTVCLTSDPASGDIAVGLTIRSTVSVGFEISGSSTNYLPPSTYYMPAFEADFTAQNTPSCAVPQGSSFAVTNSPECYVPTAFQLPGAYSPQLSFQVSVSSSCAVGDLFKVLLGDGVTIWAERTWLSDGTSLQPTWAGLPSIPCSALASPTSVLLYLRKFQVDPAYYYSGSSSLLQAEFQIIGSDLSVTVSSVRVFQPPTAYSALLRYTSDGSLVFSQVLQPQYTFPTAWLTSCSACSSGIYVAELSPSASGSVLESQVKLVTQSAGLVQVSLVLTAGVNSDPSSSIAFASISVPSPVDSSVFLTSGTVANGPVQLETAFFGKPVVLGGDFLSDYMAAFIYAIDPESFSLSQVRSEGSFGGQAAMTDVRGICTVRRIFDPTNNRRLTGKLD